MQDLGNFDVSPAVCEIDEQSSSCRHLTPRPHTKLMGLPASSLADALHFLSMKSIEI
jgi:hypothetical protein